MVHGTITATDEEGIQGGREGEGGGRDRERGV